MNSRIYQDTELQDISGYWTSGYIWILNSRIYLDTELRDISRYWTPGYIWIMNSRIYLDTELQDMSAYGTPGYIRIYLDIRIYQDISGYWTPGFLVDATFEKIGQHNNICSKVQFSSRIYFKCCVHYLRNWKCNLKWRPIERVAFHINYGTLLILYEYHSFHLWKAENFRIVDIEINAWSSLFLNIENNLILSLYPEKCIKFN